jgi:Membrane domain of glycerophosphoryl diester phosphodiesterase
MIPASTTKAPPELKARSLGEMIDAAIKIVGNNAKILMPMAAVMVLPFQVVAAIATISAQEDVKTLTAGETTKISNATIGALAASGILGLLGTVVVTGALTWFVAEYYVGRTPTAGEAVRLGLRRTPATIGSYILSVLASIVIAIPAIVFIGIGAAADSTLLIVIGAIALFVAFFWLFIRLSCAVPAIIVERLGAAASLKRSFALVKGFFWKVLGTLLVTNFLIGIVAAVISAVITGVLGALGGGNKGFAFVWQAIAGTVAAAITTPVSAAVAVLLYIDLRIRKEGFDLEVLSASLDSQKPMPSR